MKAKFIISFKPMLFVLLVYSNLFCVEQKENHTIEGMNYFPMLDGYCAMTALRMNLNYYNIKIDQGLLLNLGWNYGFIYIKTPYYSIAYPDTDPVEEIELACKLIGFKTKILTHQSINEAKESLVSYIAQNIPVLVQWIPHTIIAYGYKDNGNLIIYHDPGDPINVKIHNTSEILMFKGQSISMEITEWEKMPFLWGMRQYQMVVIEPVNRKIDIDWKKIWKRNSEKILGIIKNPFPANYGIDGIKEMIKDLKQIINQNNDQNLEILKRFDICFKLGAGFRRNTATFLAGQASILKDGNIRLASQAFLESAHQFREGFNLINWLKTHPEEYINVGNEIIMILEKIIASEKKGAEFLSNASK